MARAMSTDSELSNSTTCSGERCGAAAGRGAGSAGLGLGLVARGAAQEIAHPAALLRRPSGSAGALRSASAGGRAAMLPRWTGCCCGRAPLDAARRRTGACTGAGAGRRRRGGAGGSARVGSVDMRPDLATMSDSSFSALICSVTARRIAVVDSLASTGMSSTPFFELGAGLLRARRGSTAAVGACPRSHRRSAGWPTSTTSVMELRILSVDSLRPALGLLQRAADQVLERLHDPLEVLRLVHQPDGQVFQRRLPLSSVCSKLRLRRADQVGGVGKQPAVLVEAVGDRGDLAQRLPATARSAGWCWRRSGAPRWRRSAPPSRWSTAKLCGRSRQPLVDAEQVLARPASISSLSWRARRGQPADQVVDVFGQARCGRLRPRPASRRCGWRAR